MINKNHTSLYPDILFHFTSKKGLLAILGDTFKLSYARERIEGASSIREFAVPMISFCDLKLSELKVHMTNYGNYGIGLTKTWANDRGLNPVFYVNKHCEFADNFNNALNSIYQYLSKLTERDSDLGMTENYKKILDTYRYIKNYEGLLQRDGESYEDFRFADEREWRFVPSVNHSEIEPFVAISNIRTKSQKAEYNKKIENISLSFGPNDIKYLIVKDDSEITELVYHLRNVKRRFDNETIDRLSSRILTAEQIHNDI